LTPWAQFARFGLVGVIGFAVDASTLTLMLAAGVGLLDGRAVSYVIAGTCTWLLNRRWTFRDRSDRLGRQWAQFLAASLCGSAANYGVYALLVSHSHASSMMFPVFAVGVGSLCGFPINFLLSKHIVFEMA
jgi:putative flippase GtrA